VKAHFFDLAFISVSGLAAAGLSVSSPLNAAVMEAMIDHAERVIVLADQTKLGRTSFARLAPLDIVDVLVTDAAPADELQERLQHVEVEVLIAAPSTRPR
jgi:DeoR family fructose operon transcriptional repressor